MAFPFEMYSKFGLTNWICSPNGGSWLENDQWLTAISSSALARITYVYTYVIHLYKNTLQHSRDETIQTLRVSCHT